MVNFTTGLVKIDLLQGISRRNLIEQKIRDYTNSHAMINCHACWKTAGKQN